MDAALNLEDRTLVQIELGTAARKHWTLRDDGSFLNHGSFGACPIPVQQEQERLRRELESHPDAFMARIEPDGSERAPRNVAAELAVLMGTSADRLALVENASSGVQAVIDSVPLGTGDQILITHHQYNAVWIAVEDRCRRVGAKPCIARIPLPTSSDEVLQRVLGAATPKTKLVILDHITSSTALIFPVAQLVKELHRRHIPVLLDGAHCLGQVPLDVPSLGADWYVTNAHKWMYAPKGSAVLYASESAAPLTRPTVSSHYLAMGFPHSFDYVGTRDYTAWLSMPAALRFFFELGPERLWRHNQELVRTGTRALLEAGALSVGPDDMSAAMRAFILPQIRPATAADAAAVVSTLWERERIQIRCVTLSGQLLLRFCAQAYVDQQEMVRLGEALLRHGWPARI